MSKDVECPYCGEFVEINHDDGYGYGDDRYDQECSSCGKEFHYTTSIRFTYYPSRKETPND